MPSGSPGLLRRLFGFLWSVLDGARRLILNLLFLLIVAAVLFAWFADTRPPLRDDTALVVAIRGRIVEQYTGGASEAALAELVGEARRETQLRDLLDALNAAADDTRITSVLFHLDEFDGAGLATLREVAAAVARVREAGKPVIAWASSFDQRQYFLAAHADEVYLHPFGGVSLRGLGGYRNYYRDALDRLGVTVNVFRVGQYKSFAEPFTLNAPSREAQEDEARWLNDAWALYMDEVERARGLPAGSIAQLIETLPQRMKGAGGDAARLALDQRLVDGLKTEDELRKLMGERGVPDPKQGGFRQVSLAGYLAQLQADDSGDGIGVIVAQGDVIDGDAPQGVIGGRTISELVRRAREAPRIKALVLRIDSPGGVAFASERIRRELQLTRAEGKPVVVSIGDTAASAGYWMAVEADEIIADPGSLTGSIGVFALLPSLDRAWDKLGIHTGGATTTWLAGAGDPRRPLDRRVGDMLQATIEHSYRRFVELIAGARRLTPEQVDSVAQGRVWTGRQARERGLVDTLGGLNDAIGRAAERANLDDSYRIVYLEREPRGISRLMSLLLGEVGAALAERLDVAGWLGAAGRDLRSDLRWVGNRDRDPFATYSHCLCRLW
jgi:protease-4